MKQSKTSSLEKELLDTSQALIKDIDTLKECARILAKTVKLQDKIIKGFYDAIAHGDEDHRQWLKEEIDEYRKSYAPELAMFTAEMKALAPDE